MIFLSTSNETSLPDGNWLITHGASETLKSLNATRHNS